MLALANAIEAIRSLMEMGGDVLWAIMFVLFMMWTLILERYWYILRVFPATRREVVSYWEARRDRSSWYARRIREQLVSDLRINLRRNIHTIKALIAVCPLLGLMGTVTGMISVFDVMAFSGTGNARAMAGGVFKATIPTMAGMVAALTGVYFSTYLEHRSESESEHVEDLLQHH
ncbi:MAG: MotA/TolQ/ExbB proton channel family protein [Wenzhouxiangellaceae bacterium]